MGILVKKDHVLKTPADQLQPTTAHLLFARSLLPKNSIDKNRYVRTMDVAGWEQHFRLTPRIPPTIHRYDIKGQGQGSNALVFLRKGSK